MNLDNRTRYRSADLEAIILLALHEAGITSHVRDRVLVTYGSHGFSGWCYFGSVTPAKLGSGKREARMTLRVPDPDPVPTDGAVRSAAGRCPTHDVAGVEEDGVALLPLGYPEGSRHMRCPVGCSWIQTRRELPPREIKPLDVAAFVWLVRHEVAHWRGLDHKQMGTTIRHWKAWEAAGRPLPPWSDGLTVAIEDAPPRRPRKPAPNADNTRAKRVLHAQTMLTKAERKAKTADMLVKRWTRRVAAAERAVQRAATKIRTEGGSKQ